MQVMEISSRWEEFLASCKLHSSLISGTEIDGTTDQIMEEDGAQVQVDTIVVPHSEDFLVREVAAEVFLVEHVLPLDSGVPVEDRYILMYLMCMFRLLINDITSKVTLPTPPR